MHGRIWTEEDINKLKELYPNDYTRNVAIALDRTERATYSMAINLGLKKSEEFTKFYQKECGKQAIVNGTISRFPKGHIPANKGKTMSAELKEKVKHTFFQKGHTPQNTKYDGHERIDKEGYVLIRVQQGKYVLKHRLVWEQEHGKIPKRHVLVFKNGNKQDIRLENLEIISYEENMARNTIHNYPPEIKEVIRLTHKVERKIKDYEK